MYTELARELIYMKHEVTTMNTKKTLAASLKKFMEKKPLSKVTVSEIVTDCGLNRKTFYYHFEDVYALLKWTLEEEAIEVVKKFDLMVDYEEAILFVMDYVDSNKHMINCAYDAIGSEEMKRFFFSDFIGVVRSIVDGAESNMQLHVGEDFKQFLCEFYTQALAGMLIEWFRDRNVRDREETIQYISLIFRASLPNVLRLKSEERSERRCDLPVEER